MKKVCCHSCKYYRMGGSMEEDTCEYSTGTDINFFKEYKVKPFEPEIQNANNDCKYYKRSWLYKILFWIKY